MWACCNFKVTFYIPKRLVIMNHWTAQQRAFVVKAFYLNSCTARVFRTHFGLNRYHSVHAIKLWVNDF